MPTASYQQPNDYNLVKDIRPFDMPYASYMQEIATKGQYFKIGADRVKSVYDQAAGLDPQYTQGREYLKGFMEQANQNLQKLNKSDLSIMDNAQQAVRVFKPLFDIDNPMNAALLKDSQLNEHYKKQQKLSEMYRSKDGGKEWNMNNELYYRDAQAKYLQDAQNGDYSTIDENYQKRKSFVPYYDYKKEIADIVDSCKGQSIENQDISSFNSGYLEDYATKGCDPKRLALAFQTSLSDRAKQQMHIDGYVTYKGNEDVLLRKFNDISINNAKQEIDDIESAIRGLQAGTITKEEQAKIDKYNAILAIKKPKYKSALEEYQQLTKGNPLEYIKNNYDALAGNVYFDELTKNLGEAYRTDDVKRKLLPNAVELQQRKINADTNLQILKNNQDIEKQKQEHKDKLDEIRLKGTIDYELEQAKGNISLPSTSKPVTGVTSDTPSIPKITEADFIKDNVEPAQKASDDAYSELEGYIKSKYNKTIDDITGRNGGSIEQFVNEHNGKDLANQDQDLALLYKNFKEANRNWTTELNKVKAIDSRVASEHPELSNDSKYNDEKTKLRFKVGNINSKKEVDFSMSEKDMHSVLAGKTVNGMQYKVVPQSDKYGPTDNKEKDFYLNGERIKDPVFEGVNKFLYLEYNTRDKDRQKLENLDKYKTDLYTSKYYNNGDFTENNIKIKAGDALDQKLQGLLNTSGGNLEKNGYKITHRDRTGSGIYIQTLDDNKQNSVKGGNTTDETLALLVANSQGAKKVKTPSGWAYYLPNFTSRYEGLPDDSQLAKQQKSVDDITNLKDLLSTDSRITSKAYIDSYELPDGVITIDTPGGKEATISVVYGKSTGYSYIARIAGIKDPVKASSPLELINILKTAY